MLCIQAIQPRDRAADAKSDHDAREIGDRRNDIEPYAIEHFIDVNLRKCSDGAVHEIIDPVQVNQGAQRAALRPEARLRPAPR